MIPYPQELPLDSSNNYGIVKTETVFKFGRLNRSDFEENNFSTTQPFDWIINNVKSTGRSLNDVVYTESSRSKKRKTTSKPKIKSKSKNVAKDKKSSNQVKNQLKRKAKGVKKCIFKILKDGKGRKKKRGRKSQKFLKKYMVPLILGIMAAKSLLIPIAFKALAFLSAKGLMMGFFATIMASMISLKGMFDHSHSYQNRKDDSKTQVEIIQVPSNNDDHYYYDEHYRRGDYLPDVPYVILAPPPPESLPPDMKSKRKRQ